MENWGFEDFEKEMKKAEERNKNLSLFEDDSLTRKARYIEARNGYEKITQDERDEIFFTYRKSISINEEFTLFPATNSSFSQYELSFFKAKFVNVIEPKYFSDIATNTFTSVYQYVMYAKAMLFLDRIVAESIIKTQDMREMESLGKNIKNFDKIVWEFNKVRIMYVANKEKFVQNIDLRKSLFSTQGTTLVEIATDDVSELKFYENELAELKPEVLRGKNLLGEVLTQIRFELMGKY